MLTQAKINELLEYDPITGKLHWKLSRGFIRAGSEAGGAFRDYRVITIDGKRYSEHNLIWRILKGVRSPGKVWHLNGDRSDNRAVNLSGSRVDASIKSVSILATGGGFNVSGKDYSDINQALEAARGILCSP